MDNGWIKIHRSILDWEWYTDAVVSRLFLHLLLKCTKQNIRFRGKVLERGQYATTEIQLQGDLNLSRQQIRTALGKLEKTGEISKKSTNEYTIITICNYDSYQANETNNQPTNNQRATNNQPTNNQSIEQEYKEDKEYNISLSPTRAKDEAWYWQMKQTNTQWQEDSCRSLGVDRESLLAWITKFENEQKAKENYHQSWNDIASHFISWVKIENEKQQKQATYGNNRTSGNRGSYEPTGLEDYSGERL